MTLRSIYLQGLLGLDFQVDKGRHLFVGQLRAVTFSGSWRNSQGFGQICLAALLLQGELFCSALLLTDPSDEMGQPQWVCPKCAWSGKPRTDHCWRLAVA